MKNRLVWFLKNTKIYKRIKSIVLRKMNSYKLEVSPAWLFLMQHSDGQFNRYDIIVRYLALEDFHDARNSGIRLYNKMQLARNEYLVSINQKIKSEDLHVNKTEAFKDLSRSFSKVGYNKNYPLEVNSAMKLVDGSHRIACALFFNQKSIIVEKSAFITIDYGLDWFRIYFDDDEIDSIRSKYQALLKNIDIKAVLTSILKREKQYFGRGEFYQSCEEIGFPGQRPTGKRYEIYGLKNHLESSLDILDIGCNCGFLTLLIAKEVKSATGVEISDSLVEIGQITQVYLGRTNVYFRKGNFNKMQFNKKYDFIFSFAVHHWLGTNMKKFGIRLNKMLNPGGKILLESQNINTVDTDWGKKIQLFMEAGFEEISNGWLKDDGIIERRFSLFRKLDLGS